MNLKKLFGLSAIVFCCLVLMPLSAGAASIFYVDTYNSTSAISSLYTLTTTGTASKVGDIKLNGNPSSNLFITDIAFNENTGKMYAITATTLYTLDYLNPSGSPTPIVTATLVGNTTQSDLQGLTVSPDGTIYAASFPSDAKNSGTLYSLNANNGSVLTSNTLADTSNRNTNYRDFGDLAFVGSTFYGSLLRTNNGGQGDTYGIGQVGTTGTTNFQEFNPSTPIDGLAYESSILYGINRTGTLYTLNPSTGAVLTTIPTSGFSAGDTVYGATQAPIPPSALLLGSGLLGLGLLGWRRKIS